MKTAGMAIHYIQLGKSKQNAYVEMLIRTYRDE
ncbi:MAG: transposase [Pseudomonadota bacterium]|nr:MAG: transposase [Pseudomonadota bacterium]